MNDVQFNIKNPNAKSKSLIYAVFHLGNGQRLKISTGISISPDMWNNRKKSIKSGYTHQFETNKILNQFAESIQSTFLELEKTHGKGKITSQLLKETIDKKNKMEDFSKMNFVEIYTKFLIEKSKLVGDNTIKTYQTTLSRLKRFEKFSKTHINVSSINYQFYNEYCSFLFEKLKLSPNTVGREIKNLKVFINYLNDLGFGHDIDTKSFKGISVPSFSIALTENELDKIHRLKLNNNSKLEQVRIKFLLSCYTGMRVSDLMRFGPSNIKDDLIEYVQRKTGETVFLPRHKKLDRVLRQIEPEYKLSKISEQKYNEYIKELCQLAGIDEEMKVPVYKGRNKEFTTKRKYELVSSHTGRKTFASIGIQKGIPAEALMKFTGHKNLSVFLKYVKMPPNVYLDIMKKAWSK